METRRKIAIQNVRKAALAILQGVGVPPQDAAIVTDALIDAERSEVESHGLTRLKAYVDRLAGGQITPVPNIQVHISGAIAQIDGGNGLGQVSAMRAAQTCIQLAKEHGVGIAAVCHSNHFGTAAYYANHIARAQCIGFCATNAGPTMAPFGGTELLLGTNPFAIAFPASRQIFSADMATSAAAKGKIRIYAQKGETIPLGWALDQAGHDTTDPTEAIRGILLPMGGHKGYALAMAVDALCALLTGANLSCEAATVVDVSRQADLGHFFCAIDIAHFLPPDQFEHRAQQWLDQIRDSRPRPSMAVMIPGEPEDLRRNSCVNGELDVLTETLQILQTYEAKYGKTNFLAEIAQVNQN